MRAQSLHTGRFSQFLNVRIDSFGFQSAFDLTFDLSQLGGLNGRVSSR